MSTEPDNTGRMQGGQFAPGVSGNPAGKKAGTRHKATQAALALLSGEVDAFTSNDADGITVNWLTTDATPRMWGVLSIGPEIQAPAAQPNSLMLLGLGA
jgi:hypothetical protein